jgi:hypothetical protein
MNWNANQRAATGTVLSADSTNGVVLTDVHLTRNNHNNDNPTPIPIETPMLRTIHPSISDTTNTMLSHHASQRMQQRGITREDLDWAIGIGTVYQKQGMDMVVIRDKDIPDWVRAETRKHIQGLVVYICDGVVVTTFKAGKRAHRNLRKKGKTDRKKMYNRAA